MKKLTTPWWVYLILFAIAIAFIILCCIIPGNNNCFWDILCNIGYGIFGSLIVALLIDFANTRIKVKADFEKLRIISAEYRTTFLDLRDCVLNVSESRYGTDGKKRAFNDWIDYVLAPVDEQQGKTNEDVFDSVFDIQFRIEKIEKAATAFHELLLLNLDNEKITAEYRQNVKSVRSLSAHIDDLFQNEKYELAAQTIKERLIPKFLKNNEEYKHYFLEPYCEDSYTDD